MKKKRSLLKWSLLILLFPGIVVFYAFAIAAVAYVAILALMFASLPTVLAIAKSGGNPWIILGGIVGSSAILAFMLLCLNADGGIIPSKPISEKKKEKQRDDLRKVKEETMEWINYGDPYEATTVSMGGWADTSYTRRY